MLELAIRRVVAGELLDGGVRNGLPESSCLDTGQAGVDSPPARADEVDEQGEIVDARMALGEEVSLQALEPADGLVQETADLRHVPRDREDFRAQAVADGNADVCRNRRLELGCRRCERLDLVTRALERSFDRSRVGATCRRVCDPLLGPLEREGVHGQRGYSQRRMDTALLEYELPPELVAQHPIDPRDAARLLVYRRSSGEIEHRTFAELPALLDGELVAVNDTRVVPARFRLRRESGGAVEVLLVERVAGDGSWAALVRPSSRLRAGEAIGPIGLVEHLGEGRWLVELRGEPSGEMPLPPYIHEPVADPERYQTVYGTVSGSAAAPTAGLHLTPELVSRLDPVRVTLHVGLDTFRPVTEACLEDHVIHGERYEVSEAAWGRIAAARRVLAVGTTTVRVLETVARTGELVGRTMLFVSPGFAFARVDALVTNFHLPRSTLLALVMAFVGMDETRRIYREAVAERYRFYSFGDAMLVL